MLTEAAFFRLGYRGSWSPVGRDKSEWHKSQMNMLRLQGEHRKVAYQREHAIVHSVDLYCDEADERLRQVLGDQYAEWESWPDREEIPQDLVF